MVQEASPAFNLAISPVQCERGGGGASGAVGGG
eukprot:COSAG05_NODE_19924_length_285_cov_1.903226_1_plen_32_part_10